MLKRRERSEGPGIALMEEIYWGYTLRVVGPPRVGLVLAQLLSIFLGSAFAGVGVALWLFADPGTMTILRAGLVALALAVSAPLFWFGTRGDQVELEVDTSLGEIREVIHNRAGGPSLVARHAFDAIDAVVLEPGRSGIGRLLLQLKDGRREVELLRGPEGVLEGVGARLGRDLRHGSRRAARFEALPPFGRSGSRSSAA